MRTQRSREAEVGREFKSVVSCRDTGVSPVRAIPARARRPCHNDPALLRIPPPASASPLLCVKSSSIFPPLHLHRCEDERGDAFGVVHLARLADVIVVGAVAIRAAAEAGDL